MAAKGAVIGVSDHGGWAILMTVGRDGRLLDRRRVQLVDDDLPSIPHHHEAQLVSIEEGVALVERVRTSANAWAARAFEALALEVPNIVAIALRKRQTIPSTTAECITDYRARNVADWVMYRDALAGAAALRGWNVHWFDRKTVFAEASERLGRDFEIHCAELRKAIGPPWTADHKLAMAAAIARPDS